MGGAEGGAEAHHLFHLCLWHCVFFGAPGVPGGLEACQLHLDGLGVGHWPHPACVLHNDTQVSASLFVCLFQPESLFKGSEAAGGLEMEEEQVAPGPGHRQQAALPPGGGGRT